MKNYFDYSDHPDDEYGENRNRLFSDEAVDEKSAEDVEEKPGGFIESEKDPVRIYLKEMSSVPLLTREGEIETARHMEKGQEKVYRVVFSLPFVLNKLIAMGQISVNGELPLTEVIQIEEETAEELQSESKRFFEITREIDRLNKKRKGYLKNLKEISSPAGPVPELPSKEGQKMRVHLSDYSKRTGTVSSKKCGTYG